MTDTPFIRVRAEPDKEAALGEAAKAAREGKLDARVFIADPASFRHPPVVLDRASANPGSRRRGCGALGRDNGQSQRRPDRGF